MTRARLIEALICLLLALAVHLAILAVISRPRTEPPDPSLALSPITPDLGDLIAAWDRAPETDLPDTPAAPPAEDAPSPPRALPAAPVRADAPPPPVTPAAPVTPPVPDATPRTRPVVAGDAPAALVRPAPFAATELLTARAALRTAPKTSRAPGAALATPAIGVMPQVDTTPAAPPPPPALSVSEVILPEAVVPEAVVPEVVVPEVVTPEVTVAPVADPIPSPPDPLPTPLPTPLPGPLPDATPDVRPEPAPQPDPAPIPDPVIPDPERGPPTAQAPISSLRPVARDPGFRPDPFTLRPVARPAGLGAP